MVGHTLPCTRWPKLIHFCSPDPVAHWTMSVIMSLSVLGKRMVGLQYKKVFNFYHLFAIWILMIHKKSDLLCSINCYQRKNIRYSIYWLRRMKNITTFNTAAYLFLMLALVSFIDSSSSIIISAYRGTMVNTKMLR
jgi:hypothetical protein